ncbi:hypothetical protein [Nonomuraea typhae]|uniref:Uncharacterized protein n=1 Tax=Nonomuraea typhae TaxID=2603600 RepID=A0ABW7YPY7_9ACTN
MGEFVGIDPRGADQLIRQMESGKNTLGRNRHGLEAAISEAGVSWTGAQGTSAMHRSWAFFDDAQRDLKWRIDTLKQAIPDSGAGLLSLVFTFDSESEAARQGKADAERIAAALKKLGLDESAENWNKITAAAEAMKGKVNDPAYSAALLAALGPDRFRALFKQWMGTEGSFLEKGPSPAIVHQQRQFVGPLADAYANAERAGRLGEEWRGTFSEETDPGVLSAMIALSKPSSRLLNQVALRVLGRPQGADDSTFGQNWSLNILIEAYDADPKALQSLLANNKDAAGWLLHPGRFRRTGIPGFEERLGRVLDQALRPGAGMDVERDQAWFNIIRAMGAENSPWLGGGWGTFKDSPISETLARNVVPYLDQLAKGQVMRDSPELKSIFPRSPWDALDPDDTSRFVGALTQDPDALRVLMKASQDYMSGLDIGRFRPFGDEAIQEQFTYRASLGGGIANLMLGGTAYAEWTDDEYAEWLAELAMLPVTWAANKYWSIQDPNAATVRDVGLDVTKNGLKKVITDYFDQKTAATAEDVGDDLVRRLAEWVNTSLEAHGQKPLTEAQQNEVRMAFRGRLYDALVKAHVLEGARCGPFRRSGGTAAPRDRRAPGELRFHCRSTP